MRLVLALGSNIGELSDNLRIALTFLDGSFGPRLGVSSVLRTEAIGFEGPDFFNMLVAYESEMEPLAVLSECKRIERMMGREDDMQYDVNGQRVYHDRLIDIDILTYGDICMNTPELVIPHPQIQTRPYISTLLAELD